MAPKKPSKARGRKKETNEADAAETQAPVEEIEDEEGEDEEEDGEDENEDEEEEKEDDEEEDEDADEEEPGPLEARWQRERDAANGSVSEMLEERKEKKERKIARGGAAGYKDAVIGVAMEDGKNFISYDESKSPKDAKTNPKGILKMRKYLASVENYQGNMCIPRKAIENGIGEIFEIMKPEWKMKDSHKEEYVETLTRRAMNIHRVTQQGIEAARKDKVKGREWVWELPWMAKEKMEKDKKEEAATNPGEKHQGGLAAPTTPPAGFRMEPHELDRSPLTRSPTNPQKGDITWTSGFDVELKKAWRQKKIFGSRRRFAKELAVHHYKHDAHPIEDSIIACFADDTEIEIAEFSAKQYEELMETDRESAKKTNGKIYYEMMHKVTKNVIKVVRREDRYLLMSIYEQNSQACQIGVFSFMDNPNDIGKEDTHAKNSQNKITGGPGASTNPNTFKQNKEERCANIKHFQQQ